jgi:antitoxin component YwqK of YwqJK toxin-antitoxin module
MKKILLFVALIAIIASCKQQEYEKQVTETFPDGTPKREQYFLGKEDGRYMAKDVFYYADGQKRVEGEYNKEGKKHGDWTYWYDNGNKWSEGSFNEGLNDGERITWHENGQQHYTGEYDKGKRVGIWRFYDENGTMTKEIDYDAQNNK